MEYICYNSVNSIELTNFYKQAKFEDRDSASILDFGQNFQKKIIFDYESYLRIKLRYQQIKKSNLERA